MKSDLEQALIREGVLITNNSKIFSYFTDNGARKNIFVLLTDHDTNHGSRLITENIYWSNHIVLDQIINV